LSAQLRIRGKKMSAQAAAVASVVDLWPDGQLLDQHKITIPYWSINIRYPLSKVSGQPEKITRAKCN
jgi:hypothetical protein